MKTKAKGTGLSCKQKREKFKLGALTVKQAKPNKSKNSTKSNYLWKSVNPRGSKPSTLTRYSNKYHRCLDDTGTASGKGCDKCVWHKLNTCGGYVKIAAKVANQSAPSKKRCSHYLPVKEVTIALKYAMIAEDSMDAEYASTLEPQNPERLYQSTDHKSSDLFDSKWHLKISRMVMLLFLATITSNIISSIYKPSKKRNKIDKSKPLDFKNTLNNICITLFFVQKYATYITTTYNKAKSLANMVL